MESKQAFINPDLGGGDGGKGGVVHKECVQKKAHTVVKVGGAQGSHGVRTALGQSHNFSQFGCGTFEGTKTHISEIMLVEPYLLLEEAKELKYRWGIYNIFDYLTIDENALCITPYHTITSRLRELFRKNDPKGTVGIGAGEAVLDSEKYPELAIYTKDLNDPDLRKKISGIRDKKISDLSSILQMNNQFLPEDKQSAQEHIDLLFDKDFVDRILERFTTLAKTAKIVNSDYLKTDILSKSGTVVFESSHGVLTDRYYGFHPHTTKIRTIPQKTLDLLTKHNYDGEIFKIGITRGYQIRHGAGPMVTHSPLMLDSLMPGSSKETNRWQGEPRVGPLDLVSLRYAIEVCGGPQFFSGLAITWFDQIQKNGRWDICDNYTGAENPTFFSSDGRIIVRRTEDNSRLFYQEHLGKELLKCSPVITSYDLSGKSKEEIISLCTTTLKEKLGVPVKMISFGPTEDHKICL